MATGKYILVLGDAEQKVEVSSKKAAMEKGEKSGIDFKVFSPSGQQVYPDPMDDLDDLLGDTDSAGEEDLLGDTKPKGRASTKESDEDVAARAKKEGAVVLQGAKAGDVKVGDKAVSDRKTREIFTIASLAEGNKWVTVYDKSGTQHARLPKA